MAKNEARLGMDITDFEKKLTKATNELNKFARGGAANMGNLGNAIGTMTGRGSSNIMNLAGSVASLAGAFGVTISAVNMLKDSIEMAMNFEKSLSGLKALTGLGKQEMQYLKESAIQLGSTSTQTASQVVDAFKLIGSAKPELLKDAQALKEVTAAAITLAEAAGMEVPDAAKALTGVMNQFGIASNKASDVINMLAAASQQGAGDIVYLNGAIVKAGSVAKSMGVQVDEVVAELEQLAQAGVDASSAGTGLRNIMLALAKTGKSELDPSVNGVIGAMKNLKAMGLTTVQMMDMFGKENVAAAQTLMETAEKAGDMRVAINGTNTAYQQAAINTDNFSGSVNSLSSAWEGLMLTINSSNGILKYWVDQTTYLIKNIQWLLSNSSQRIDMMVNIQMNGKDGASGLKAMIKKTLDDAQKAGKSEGEATYDAFMAIEDWYEKAKNAQDWSEDELAALEKAYKQAKRYVTDYYKDEAVAVREAEENAKKNADAEKAATEAQKKAAEAAKKKAAEIKKLTEDIQTLNEKLLSADENSKLEIEAQLRIKQERLTALGKTQGPTSGQMIEFDPVLSMTPDELVADWLKGRDAATMPIRFEPMSEDELMSEDETFALQYNQENLESLNKALGKIKELRTEIEGLKKESISASMSLVGSLVSLGDTIEGLGESFANCKSAWDYLSTGISAGLQIMQTVIGIMETLNALSAISTAMKEKEVAVESAKTTAASASSAASAANTIAAGTNATAMGVEAAAAITAANALKTEAAAAIFAAHAAIPFVGVPTATAFTATMMGTLTSVSAVPLFAEGTYATKPTLGIFGEAGPEFVLPEKKLDEAFERNNAGGVNGEVVFKIKDSELVGILKQANAKASRRV